MIRPSSHTSCDTSVYTLDLYQSLCEHSFFKVQLPLYQTTNHFFPLVLVFLAMQWALYRV